MESPYWTLFNYRERKMKTLLTKPRSVGDDPCPLNNFFLTTLPLEAKEYFLYMGFPHFDWMFCFSVEAFPFLLIFFLILGLPILGKDWWVKRRKWENRRENKVSPGSVENNIAWDNKVESERSDFRLRHVETAVVTDFRVSSVVHCEELPSPQTHGPAEVDQLQLLHLDKLGGFLDFNL